MKLARELGDLDGERVAVLVRLRSARCFYADPDEQRRTSRPYRHGRKLSCDDAATRWVPMAEHREELPALLVEQLRRVLSMFIQSGDDGSFYYADVPAFDVLTASLVWLGMGVALARLRRFFEMITLLWFWLGVLSSGVFTSDAPSGQRLLVVVTAGFLFGGLLVTQTSEMVQRTLLRRVSWLSAPIGASLAIMLLSYNVAIYFGEYALNPPGIQATMVARELRDDAGRHHAYLLTGPVFYPSHGAIRFIALDVPVQFLDNASEFQPPPHDGRGVLVIALEDHLQGLRAIKARLPGGSEATYSDPLGRPVYTTYRVPPG